MIPGQRKPAGTEMDRPDHAQPNRTINLGDIASAWPSGITVSVTIIRGRPTYHAVVAKPKGKGS